MTYSTYAVTLPFKEEVLINGSRTDYNIMPNREREREREVGLQHDAFVVCDCVCIVSYEYIYVHAHTCIMRRI